MFRQSAAVSNSSGGTFDSSWRMNEHSIVRAPARPSQYAGAVTTNVFGGGRFTDERFGANREFHGDVQSHAAFSSVFFQRSSKVCPPRPDESEGEHEKYCAEKYRNADRPKHALLASSAQT